MKARILLLAVVIPVTVLAGIIHAEKENGASVTLTKVYNQVECQRGGKNWARASAGIGLSSGDSLKTLNNSYAEMRVDPPNRFRLNENAMLNIKDLWKEAKDRDGSVFKLTEFELLTGEIIARLDSLPSDSRLKLRSPVAVAAVRGTTFMQRVDPENATSVAVSAGRVRVEASGEEDKNVMLDANRQTVVSPWSAAVIHAAGTGLPPKKMLMKRLSDPRVPIEEAKEMVKRLEQPRPSLESIVLSAEGVATAPPDVKKEGEARDLALAAARGRALEIIINKLKLLKLGEEETIGDLMDKDGDLCGRILSFSSRAESVRSAYNEKKRTAVVVLSLPLKPVKKIIGRDLAFAWKKISPVTLEEYSYAFGGVIRLAAERAATVDAYRRLAETIYGTVVTSTTTLRDFAVKSDRITVAVKGVVQGAEEVSKTYYSDGSIDVVMSVRGGSINVGVRQAGADILGKNYMASPSSLSADEFISLMKAKEL